MNARGEVSRCINLTLGASASRDVKSTIHGSAIVPFSLFFDVMESNVGCEWCFLREGMRGCVEACKPDIGALSFR